MIFTSWQGGPGAGEHRLHVAAQVPGHAVPPGSAHSAAVVAAAVQAAVGESGEESGTGESLCCGALRGQPRDLHITRSQHCTLTGNSGRGPATSAGAP